MASSLPKVLWDSEIMSNMHYKYSHFVIFTTWKADCHVQYGLQHLTNCCLHTVCSRLFIWGRVIIFGRSDCDLRSQEMDVMWALRLEHG